HGMVPPPGLDSSLASQFVQACSDNYSNYSRGSGDIDMVVIHTVQGSYSSCYNWFANCSAQASAHYVVRSSDGDITQMVSEGDVAWHAGHWDTNLRSVGIEHEGYIDDPGRWYTDAMYRASAALTLDIATRQGVAIDRSHIIGHSEVPGCSGGSGGGSGCHTDPGSGWDWDYYMDLLNGATNTTTGELVGVVADSDIYNGTRLVGATVWIPETGDSTTTDSSGVYHFPDLPFGTYTVHASYPGYAEGTCGPKTTSAAQDWCSVALYPGEDPGPDDSDPPPDDSSPVTGDDSGVDEVPGHRPPSLPGTPVVIDEVKGGCSTGAGPLLFGLLMPLFLRRKQC
ncbi:MAG TPA: N-acetylmuramoyl-L-alanine amidase, partial [Myxococcota bacterium]|nr:N-acetylmuramoyl-L-alanine amidase [Myxococcota bacterium]